MRLEFSGREILKQLMKKITTITKNGVKLIRIAQVEVGCPVSV